MKLDENFESDHLIKTTDYEDDDILGWAVAIVSADERGRGIQFQEAITGMFNCLKKAGQNG